MDIVRKRKRNTPDIENKRSRTDYYQNPYNNPQFNNSNMFNHIKSNNTFGTQHVIHIVNDEEVNKVKKVNKELKNVNEQLLNTNSKLMEDIEYLKIQLREMEDINKTLQQQITDVHTHYYSQITPFKSDCVYLN